jgi:hypothetical protein
VNPLDALRSPFWWLALGVLLVNDHGLKGAGILPPLITGKLSDFAGMIVAPPLFAVLFGVRRLCGWIGCLTSVGLGFSLIKLFPAVASATGVWAAAASVPFYVRSDPYDLVALPLLVVTFRLATSRTDAVSVDGSARYRNHAGVILGGLACLATGAPKPAPRYARAPDQTLSRWSGYGPVEVMTLDGNWKPLALPEVAENASAFVVTSQQIYLGGNQGVSAYDRDTGRRLFRTRIDCVDCQTWMVLAERQLVLFTQNSGAIAEPKTAWVFALDPTSGAVLKYLKLEATIESGRESRVPCYADGAVYVPTDSGVVKLEPTLSSQSVMSVDEGPPCLKGDFEAVNSKPLDETETPR